MVKKSSKSSQVKEIKEFEEEVIQIDRVVRVVKGGRRLRFRATVAIGNRNGKAGIGIGKSNEVTGAIQKAIAKAKKNLVEVPLYNGTIPHEIKTKFKSCRLLMLPAGPGTGIIAGGAVRKIANLAGIKNLLSKSFGSSNRVNMAQLTIKTLGDLQELPGAKKDVMFPAAPKKVFKQEGQFPKKDHSKRPPMQQHAKPAAKSATKPEAKQAPTKEADTAK